MQTHSRRCGMIVQGIIDATGLESFTHIRIASKVPDYHHEKMDGSGYPRGLADREIPIEARIVAFADIFDALTSNRPYKKAWTTEDALTELYSLTPDKLDRRCVDALAKNIEKVEWIKKHFQASQGDKPEK